MESSAFPDKIKIKWTRLKIYKMMKMFYVPKIAQKYSKSMSFNWKHQENTLFYFDCYSEGNASIKKRST